MASLFQNIQGDADPTRDLPRFSDVAQPPQGSTTRNPIAAGVSSDIDQLQATGGAFAAALGDALNSKALKDWGVGVYQRNANEAAANGRRDLDAPIWEQGLTSLPGWLGYKISQQVPQMAAQIAGGTVVGRGMRAAGMVLPEAAAELGARAPQALGGGGFGFKTMGPIPKEVLDVGRKYAEDVTGIGVAGYPMAVGSMYQEAIDRGDANRGDAFKALAYGPAYAALDAVGPEAQLKGLVTRGSKGALATRVLTAAFAGAATEMPQEAVQTAMEQSFRPDLSPMEKFKNIVDAAVTGGIVGGFAGGVGGIRRAKSLSSVTDDDLKSDIDNGLKAPSTGPAPNLTLTGEQPEAQRPFAKEPIERVQGMLADVESRIKAGGTTQADAINRQQLRDELGARVAETQPARPYASVPDADLNNALMGLESRQKSGQATDEEANVGQLIQQEIAARQAETQQLQAAVKQGPEQPTAPETTTPVIPGFENLPNQRTPQAEFEYRDNIRQIAEQKFNAEQNRQLNAQQQAHQQLTAIAGLKTVPASFAKQNITTLEDGFGHAKERLDQGNAPKWAIAIGKYTGLLDENGNDQTTDDIQKKMDDNRSKMQVLYDKFGLTKSKQFEVQIANLQEQQKTLANQKQMVQAATDNAQAREQAKNPPDTFAPGPARLRAPDGTYQDVRVLDKQPIEQGGKKYQPVVNSKGVEYNVPIETLHPSVPDTETVVARSPQPRQQSTEPARGPLPLKPREESGGPIVQPLKSPLFQNTDTAQREGFTPLRGETETAAQIGRNSEVRGVEPSNAPQALTAEETQSTARDISRYEPVLGEIVSNKELPVPMRRAAREARDQLRSGTGYHEAVNSVLADYSAHTGDYQYQTSTPFGKNQSAVEAATDKVLDRRGVLDPVQRQALRDRALQMLEKDAQDFANNPEGPFKGAESNVVSSASVDPRYNGFLKDMMHSLGLGNVRVFLYHPEDVRGDAADSYSLHGPFNSPTQAERRGSSGGVGPFGVGNKDFHMMVKSGFTPEHTIEVISHELGHMIWHIALAKASPEERTAIRNEYLKWHAKNQNTSAQQLVKSLRNRYTAAHTLNNIEERLRSQQIPNAEEYWMSEGEWFADQVSRWTTTSAKPMSVVDKFFSKIGQMMKALLRSVIGQGYMPAQSVKEFLDKMGPNTTPFDWEGFKGKYSLKDDPTLPSMDYMLDNIGKVGPEGLHDRLNQIMGKADTVLNKLSGIPWSEASNQLNKLHMYATTIEHITKFFGPLFKPGTLEKYRDLHVLQRAIQGRLAHLMAQPYQQWEALNSANKKAGQGVLDLMNFTFADIDPRKRWEQHDHLHNAPNADFLKQRTAEANKLYNEMSRIVENGTRASTVYDHAVAANEAERYASQTTALYNVIQANASVDQVFKDSVADPMQQYMQNAKVYEDVNASRQYWKDARDGLLKSVNDYVSEQQGRLSTMPKADANRILSNNTSLTGLVTEIGKQDDAMARAPYFHVGRFGNYFAAFKMATNEDGSIDPKNLQRVAKLIDKGKFGLSVPLETVKDRIFARFETQDEADRFEKLMTQLEKEKLLTRDGSGKGTGQEPKLGQRGETPFSSEPLWAQSLISSISQHFEDSAMLDDLSPEQVEERKAIVGEFRNHIHQFFQNMIPDASILKVNLQRHGIAGFTPDMMRSYAFRSSLGSEALAGMHVAPKMTEAMKGIRSEVENAKVLGETSSRQRYTMQNVLFELLKREANRTVMNRNSFFDMWRAVNHNYFLGLSPSFVMTQMIQLPQYLWPRLASKHGFVRSAQAIKDVTPTAFRILRATIQHGYEGTWTQALDASVTSKVLEKAKVSEGDREFILRLANSGLFDMGSQSRELGRVVEGRRKSSFDVGMRIASSFGFYSEMLGRLISALSAKKLYDGPAEGLDKYAHDTVSSSMFEFSNWNTSRAMSRHGVLGPFTPVATAFMSYTQQVLETLTREMHTAFVNKAATPTQKQEARRFLGAHMAAMAFFAGSLGLPAASIFAAATNNLADLFGDDKDEPYDVKVAYRRFLASVFGEGVGEVLARGVPRALGFDISQRVGEADILPFSRLLSDRRQWNDAFDSYTTDMLGSPVSMVKNVAGGALAIGHGDLINGAKMFVPQALKGMLEAYKMTDRGYQDKQGNILPMDASTLATMYQLLGLTPAGRAEYDEEARAYQATRGQMIRKASQYRKELATAIEDGDTETASEMIANIRRFDQRNPNYAVLPTIGSTIARRARERLASQPTGAPLGIPTGLQDQFSFGNVR